ncbi:MAG: acetyl-CoA carboxylase biotin carboxyl carrier protein subunit, partial [Candidatus Krumholzibacteriia bacterium]
LGNVRHRVFTARDGDERWAFVSGRTVRLRRRDPDSDVAEEVVAGGPNLVADMPGKVVKILVAEGDTVAAGQPVLIMESMKMETELAAALPGRVARIHVETGQTVAQGASLLDVEPGEE